MVQVDYLVIFPVVEVNRTHIGGRPADATADLLRRLRCCSVGDNGNENPMRHTEPPWAGTYRPLSVGNSNFTVVFVVGNITLYSNSLKLTCFGSVTVKLLTKFLTVHLPVTVTANADFFCQFPG